VTTSPIDTSFATRIKQVRAFRGLSKEGLAAAADLSLRAIEYWESGETKPTLKSLARIAEATGCDLQWLITGYGRQPRANSHRFTPPQPATEGTNAAGDIH
jgi:transcriptional regulator with XRE-family HTH domain